MKRFFLITTFIFILTANSIPVLAQCPGKVVASTVGLHNTYTFIQRSDIIKWGYKSIDGVLYKRQYNYTRQEWVGDWIRA